MGASRMFSRVGKLQVWGQKPRSVVQEWSAGGGLMAKPPEADDGLWKNAQIIRRLIVLL